MAFDDVAFLTAVASHIASTGLGSVGGNIFADTVPASPAVVTGVMRSGGTAFQGNPIARKGIEIVHRATNPRSGSSMMTQIDSLFDDKFNVLSSCSFNGRFRKTTEPTIVGYDENENQIHSVKYVFVTISP